MIMVNILAEIVAFRQKMVVARPLDETSGPVGRLHRAGVAQRCPTPAETERPKCLAEMMFEPEEGDDD